jgi:Response regulators consisting of a CheY-like receiver domain and a winged-helix DNA-binding domain
VEKVKVLLVDDNVQLLESLKDFLSDKSDIEVCGLAEDGQHAIRFLQDMHIDVLILDIIMPNLDGMAVLDWLTANKEVDFPDIIIVSALRHEDIVRITSMKGVKYFMTKPISYEQLYKRISEIRGVKEIRKEVLSTVGANALTIDEEITSIFLSIGIPAHFKGYQFLREGVRMMVEKRNTMKNITQELYPTIADHFSTTPSKVESAMRHAINISWTQGKLANINKIFGYEIINTSEKPTNGQFIALIAEKILSQKRFVN